MKTPALVIAAICMSFAAHAADFTRITSAEVFQNAVANRTLVDKYGDTMTFAGNGGLVGKRDDYTLSGGWVWNNGALCHRTRLNGIVIEVDCKHVYYRADMVLLMQDRGRSTQESWTFR